MEVSGGDEEIEELLTCAPFLLRGQHSSVVVLSQAYAEEPMPVPITF